MFPRFPVLPFPPLEFWSCVFQSCDFHPCDLVPRFPVPRFPFPRFQSPLQYAYIRVVGQQRRRISPRADDLSCGTTAEDEQVADYLLTVITARACSPVGITYSGTASL